MNSEHVGYYLYGQGLHVPEFQGKKLLPSNSRYFSHLSREYMSNRINTRGSDLCNLAIGSASFSKNVFFPPGLEVISTKINKGSLAFHRLPYHCLLIKVISCWLEFYFSLNHLPLLVLDPAVIL